MIRRRKRKSKYLMFFLVTLFAFCLLKIGGQEYDIYTLHQKQANAQQRIDELKKHKAELEAERKRLDDPRYIEKLAREDYNMVGKDEVPLFIVGEQQQKQ